MSPLSLQLEQTVHQFVDRIDLDNQELLVKDLVVFRVHETQTFCEVGSGLEQVVVAEVADARLPHRLQVVHEDRSGLLGLLPVLLSEGLDPLLYLLNFRLILDLGQTQGLNVVQEVLHVGLSRVTGMLLHQSCLLEVYDDSLLRVAALRHPHCFIVYSRSVFK